MSAQGTVHVLQAEPELAAVIPSRLRAAATAEVRAPLLRVAKGAWEPPNSGRGLGLLLLGGLLLRRVGIEGRFGAELIGEGDLVRPWQPSPGLNTLPEITEWRALTPIRMAILNEDVSRRIAQYPELSVALVERSIRRTRAMARTMAIAHQVRIDVRVHLLLWLLAERWGRVRSDGVLLPLKLTHAVLGELVGAQRATVTTGMANLTSQGLVCRTSEGFELHGVPPGHQPDGSATQV